MADLLECSYCGRDTFTSSRALTQHHQRNKKCAAKARKALFGRDDGYQSALEFMEYTDIAQDKTRAQKQFQESISTISAPKNTLVNQRPLTDFYQMGYLDYDTGREYDDNSDGMYHGLDHDSDSENAHDPPSEDEHEGDCLGQPNEVIQGNFQTYCDRADHHFLEFLTKKQVTAIKLLAVLRQTKASLDTYEAVMMWHLLESGHLEDHQTLGDTQAYLSRKLLFKFLGVRYNFDSTKWNIPREITLPSSRAKARIILNDAQAAMQSLLTDPRIRDEDYLFFDDDPFAPPPADLDYLADINTGLSYTKTYERLIRKPGKQVLLPVPFYIDGAATGQFADLKITAVKFTLGIFTRTARKRAHMWRILGFLPDILPKKSRGQRLLINSGHVDGVMAHQNAAPDEGNLNATQRPKAQDFHAMLAEILEGFVTLQETGFIWDLFYKGKLYEGIEFIPYVPFIACDTDEADRLCGAYTSRTASVKQLCRYCLCPTAESDDPLADYSRKTVPMMQELVDDRDKKGLKSISQHFITNSTYLLRFGAHNTEGIHGATPLEMLHALLLGVFMYIRDMFFEQTGESLHLSDEMNALAIEYGVLFSRQSDRDLPKTKFSNGIRAGKLMAKEFTGVLLVLGAAIRSTHGRQLLTDANNGQNNAEFLEVGRYRDWISLIETLLQWEVWLKSDEMRKTDVERAETKHRYIMALIKKVGNRVKGMGLKLLKFHAIMHMAQDMIHYGVPMNYDTGDMEAGHKPVKVAAKLTQKKEETFDEQTGKRLGETHLIDMALEEIQGRKLWNYDLGHQHSGEKAENPRDPYLGGSQFGVQFDEEQGRYVFRLLTRTVGMESMKVEQELVTWVGRLQEKLAEHMDSVRVYANHHRNGLTFRGSPMHTGRVWRDWALVDWGDHGRLPCKVWGFVDLFHLPQQNGIKYGGLDGIPPALYAIVECASYIEAENEVERSEIFVPILKEVRQMRQGRVTKLKFYLADVEAFVEPMAVIPDIGGPANGYFAVKSRAEWRKDFVRWLRSPHLAMDLYGDNVENSDEEDEYLGLSDEDSEETDDSSD